MNGGILCDNEISKIKGENNSIKILRYMYHNIIQYESKVCAYNLQKKFPNLNDFFFHIF